MLETERLIIRPFQKNDYQDYHEYMSAPETFRFERGSPMSLKDAKKFCQTFAGKTAPGFWAAVLKGNTKVIGNVSFFPEGNADFNTWQIGYIFHPDYYNQGYATEATRAVIKYAFTELGAHRIVANCSPDNTASWKVLEKCGMRREGTAKKDFPLRNDEKGKLIWLDSYSYTILDEEFV